MSRPRGEPAVKRFWSKVEVGGPDECWPFTGCRTAGGYGVFWADGKSTSAHRFAYGFTYGATDAANVCHSCDNPPCCNPAHLWPGSALENVRDKIAKGRAPYTMLTEEQAHRIKFGNEKPVNLALEFGVSQATVSMVRAGKRLKWISARPSPRAQGPGSAPASRSTSPEPPGN